MLMLIYTLICLLFIVFSYVRCVKDSILDKDITATKLFLSIFSFFFSISLTLTVGGFALFHFVFLIKIGKTTLEYCENKKEKD